MTDRAAVADEAESCWDTYVAVRLVFLLIGVVMHTGVARHFKGRVPRPRIDPRAKLWAAFPPPGLDLPATLRVPYPPEYEQTYYIPEHVMGALRYYVGMLPVNPRTGLRQVMFTVFNFAHIRFAQNLLCSQLAIGYDLARHLYIALDGPAMQSLRRLQASAHPPIVLFDVTGRGFKWKQLCMLKLVIQYQLLLMNVDTTICDDDIVFYKDPWPLFDDRTDFQVESEGPDRMFHTRFSYHMLNSGFFRVVPSELSIRFYNFWANIAIPNTTTLDQYILGEIVEPYRDKSLSGRPRQYYDMGKLIDRPGQWLRIAWFDPLHVPTAKLWHWERLSTIIVARQRGITNPHVVHAAYLLPTQKPIAFAENQLWLTESGRCVVGRTLPELWPPHARPIPQLKRLWPGLS